MARRIVLFGASGYTGQLVAAALVRARVRPVLAGRSAQNLAALGVTLGHGLDTAVADVTQPASLLELFRPGDILVSTVGPFARFGRPVVLAAIERGATYLDSSGEPAFIRDVFEELGGRAKEAGVCLVPGFAYEYVAGNLAAALALENAGEHARGVHVGYFRTGSARGGISVGTRSSAAGAALAPHFAWRDGELVTTTLGDRVRTFSVGNTGRPALAIGGSEHLSIPSLYPSIREVGVYVGGPWPQRVATRIGPVISRAARLRGFPEVVRWVGSRPRTDPGPDVEARARTGSLVIAVACDSDDNPLSTVELTGSNPYTFTGEVLAWAAMRVASHGVRGDGARGPVEAFGLGPLRDACRAAGLGDPLDDNPQNDESKVLSIPPARGRKAKQERS